MIEAQSIPAILLASITLYTAIYHLLLSCRRHHRRINLTFGLSCLAMGLYDICCAGLYSAQTTDVGMLWQRRQMISLALVGIAFIWFCSDYTHAVSWRFRALSSVYFGVTAIALSMVDQAVLFYVDRPVYRSFHFMGHMVGYEKAYLTPAGTLFQIFSILAFIYILIVGLRFYQRERWQRALPMTCALIAFFFGAVYDAGVAAGLIRSVHILEYAYMGIVFLMAVRLATDATNVAETRALLNEMETRFRAFFRNTAVGLALTDEKGVITRVNPGVCQMFGQSSQTLLGQSILSQFEPDDRKALQRMIDRILAGNGTTFRSERKYHWPDGSVYWGDISISTVGSTEDATGIEGLIWIIVGITERRHAVDSMRSLNEELEGKVQDRTQSLIATNQHLEASLRQLRADEEAGKAIQTSLLPSAIEQLGPLVFSRHLKPSFYMSGDFVDYFRIDPTHVAFYIADVSGHGVSSAFITVLLKSFVSYARERFMNREDQDIRDPAALLARLNTELLAQNVAKHLTLFYGVINTESNQLTFANGGQFPYPILLSGSTVEDIKVKGAPLGLFPFSEYTNSERTLPASFVLVLFSDGILELLEQPRLMDRQEHLQTIVQRSEGDLGRIVKRLPLTTTEMPPDDISILVVQQI